MGIKEIKTAYLYDAFISYSHAVDKKLAPSLQTALHKLAKPWYKKRALNVFRDQTDLSATPHLWGNIENALRDSKYLVLMASPEAASSKWIKKEIEFWLKNKSKEHILIALTEGEIIWDEKKRDFDWEKTNAVPTVLKGAFEMEPLYVDLRGFHSQEHLSYQNPGFKNKVVYLAATLHDKNVGDMIGEEVKQHKKTIRIRNTAIFSLVLLLAISLSATVIAIGQRNRAVRQSMIALSRQLAAQSITHLDDQLDMALLLSLEACRIKNTVEARSSLIRGIIHNPHLNTFMSGHKNIVYSVAFSPDGKMLASGSENNTIILWDVESRQPLGQPLEGHKDSVYSVAFSPDGKMLASGSWDNTIILWDVSLESWKDHACRIANRNFTPEEWRRYFGNKAYRKTCPNLPAPEKEN